MDPLKMNTFFFPPYWGKKKMHAHRKFTDNFRQVRVVHFQNQIKNYHLQINNQYFHGSSETSSECSEVITHPKSRTTLFKMNITLVLHSKCESNALSYLKQVASNSYIICQCAQTLIQMCFRKYVTTLPRPVYLILPKLPIKGYYALKSSMSKF